MLKINAKTDSVIIEYCGFTVAEKLSSFSSTSPELILTYMVNKLRVDNCIPATKETIKCELKKIYRDGTHVYDHE